MLLCPWGFPGKNTGVCCHFLLQGIFLTQGSSPYPLHCRQNLYCWATKEACIIDNFFILKFSLWLCRRMSLCIWDAYYIVWDSRALYRKIILRWFGYNKSLLYLQIFYKFDILSKIMCFEDSAQFSPVALLCLTLCNLKDCSTPGFPILLQHLQLAQTLVHQVSDAIQPSHPLLFPSLPTLNLSQH